MCIVLTLKSYNIQPASMYGMFLGGISTLCVNYIAGPDNDPIFFQPENFMYLLLPPIVLSSGLTFNFKQFFGTALAFAWIGTIITACWTALGIYCFNWVENIIIASWVGCILSPTDPVGTIGILRRVRVPERIQYVIENESVLNDAVAIVMVHFIQHVWHKSSTNVGFHVLMILLSIFSGIGFGWLYSYQPREPYSIIVIGMLVFSLHEMIQGSGILSLFTFGATIRYFISEEETLTKYKSLVISLSEFSETYVYIMMGGTVINFVYPKAIIGVIAAFSCFVGRIISIFSIGGVASMFGYKWSLQDLILMSCCGMRGAVSLALAVSTPSELRPMFVTITVMQVMISMGYTTIILRLFY
jgi:CPA1 family monovalent cation:H+ antiporter